MWRRNLKRKVKVSRTSQPRLGFGSWTSSWLEFRDKAGTVSDLRAFSTAISSQHWNLGQDKQSFHTLRGSRPRSTSWKPSFAKKLSYISEREYCMQIVVNGFVLEGLYQKNPNTLLPWPPGPPPKTLFHRRSGCKSAAHRSRGVANQQYITVKSRMFSEISNSVRGSIMPSAA